MEENEERERRWLAACRAGAEERMLWIMLDDGRAFLSQSQHSHWSR